MNKRNVRRIVLALLALAAVVGGAAYWVLIGRVRHLEVYQTAMQTIKADQRLQQSLGRPIQDACYPFPSPRIEEREIDVRWRVRGPKGHADAHVTARLMMGKWQMVSLEATLADGKRILLNASGDTEAEAPAYHKGPEKSATEKSQQPAPDAPAPDIQLPVPPADDMPAGAPAPKP